MWDLDGVVLGLLAPLCWGTWIVPMKWARTSQRWPCASFLIFAYCYAIGVCLMLVCVAMIAEYHAHSQLTGLLDVSIKRAVAGLMAGVVWQVGNLLVALTVQNAGPGFAMCCCGSIAMVLGTGLTYWISPQGNVPWLCAGVVLAVAAASLTFQMHRVKDRALKRYHKLMAKMALQEGDTGSTGIMAVLPMSRQTSGTIGSAASSPPGSPSGAPQRKAGRRLTFLLGFGSGLGVALFGPLNTLALVPLDFMGPAMSANAGMFYFGIGVFISSQIMLPLCRALVPKQFEDQVSAADQSLLSEGSGSTSFCSKFWQEATNASLPAILLSVAAGGLWAFGLWANLECSFDSGFALAYGLGQTSSLPSILWGVFLFREFSGDWVPRRAIVLLILILLLYFGAVGCFVLCKVLQ